MRDSIFSKNQDNFIKCSLDLEKNNHDNLNLTFS